MPGPPLALENPTIRPPARDDAAAVAELVATYDAHYGITEHTPAEEILGEWETLDLEHDVWLVETGGTLAAYASTEAPGGIGIVRADGYVHPAFAGRGLGTLLLRLTEERARRLAAGEERAAGVLLHNTTLLADHAAQELLGAAGYRPVNWSYRMGIDLDADPNAPSWPPGITVRSLDPERDLEAYDAALQQAFAEHFGAVRTLARLRETVSQPDFDPSLWFLAEDGGAIAGVVECLQHGTAYGFVRHLGVRAPWRGQGLGLALLRHALRELYHRGQRRVLLGVDANNATGAVRLYERVGMSIVFGAVTFEKQLRPGRENVRG